MENNEIYIDGVNVAECENYVHIEEERYKPECNCRLTTVERGYYCDTYATSVCEEENCKYKQLKRLEQENEKLKEEKLYRGIDRQFIEDANDKLFYQAEKYHKALEEIREIVTDIIKDNGRHNLSDYSSPIRIEKIINEVLDAENNK